MDEQSSTVPEPVGRQPEPSDAPSPATGGPAPVGSSPADPTQPLEPRTRREARLQRQAQRRHPWLRRSGLTLAGLLVVALVAGLLAVQRLNGNIHTIDLGSAMGQRPTSGATDPTTNLSPLNIVLLGTDGRAGLGTDKYGSGTDIVGARSDVTMVAHLAADRRSATVVSIPRDAMVKAPKDCDPAAPESEWVLKQFNTNYEQGGAACTIRVLEAMTGLYVDHVAAVDFNGFKDMVNALGTVEVCLTAPVKDSDSGANFPAGRQRLDGEQALSFVRLRHTGDGSDTSRIKRQQDFLSSVVREATSNQLLLNPAKLYRFLDAATSSLSTDDGLDSVTALASVASSLRHMPTGEVRFVSMPWEPYPNDENRIRPSAAAANVWKLLREDAPWPGTEAAKRAASASASASAGATSSGATTTAAASAVPSTTLSSSAVATIAAALPATVTVDVVNASTKEGIGTQTAAALEAQGFVVDQVLNGTTPVDGVVIHHVPADAAKARSLAAAFDGAVLKPDGKAGKPLRLEVGRGASKVTLVPNARAGAILPTQVLVPPPATSTIEAKAADEAVCTDTGS